MQLNDPATARWLSRDQIGEEGRINFYGYVRNQSISLSDRLGLFDGRKFTEGVAKGIFALLPFGCSRSPEGRFAKVNFSKSTAQELDDAINEYKGIAEDLCEIAQSGNAEQEIKKYGQATNAGIAAQQGWNVDYSGRDYLIHAGELLAMGSSEAKNEGVIGGSYGLGKASAQALASARANRLDKLIKTWEQMRKR